MSGRRCVATGFGIRPHERLRERNSSKFAKAVPWIYIASLLATHTILAPTCFCASPCNNTACATVLQSFGVTAEMIRPLVSKVLRATYRTDDLAAIQAIRANLPKLGARSSYR